MRPVFALCLAGLAFLASAPAPGRAAEEFITPPAKPAIASTESDNLAERTERADAVCVAEALKVEDRGEADCRVLEGLKGALSAGGSFRVRFDRVFGGAWPEKGVTAIYFLRGLPGGKKDKPLFRLISEVEGLAQPSPDRVGVVASAAAGRYVKSSGRRAQRLLLPDPNSVEGLVIDAPYVVSGVVQEVALSADDAAVLTFRIEKCYKGDQERGKISVRVPAVDPAVADPAHPPLAPKVGPAALMFYRGEPGGPFRLLSPFRGYVGAKGAEEARALDGQLAFAIENEKQFRARGLVGSPAERDTIAGTLLAWQNAWNSKREVQNCIACYSQRSPWRRKWESGPEARRELAATLEKYPGSIEAVVDRIDQSRNTARVSVRLRVISAGSYVEVRPVTMAFVFENGQWLILDEGN